MATPIGWQPADFTVLTVVADQQIRSLDDASNLLAGDIPWNRSATQDYASLNFVDPHFSRDGHFRKHNIPFATNLRGNDDNFALETAAEVFIPAAGDYTFGTNSDDGVRVTIEDQTMETGILHRPHDLLHIFHFDAPGAYPLQLMYFEHRGLSELEFFAALGDFKRFHKRGAKWALVGDTAHGGLEIVKRTVSVGSAPPGGPGNVGSGNPPQVGTGTPIVIPEPSAIIIFLTAGAGPLLRRRG